MPRNWTFRFWGETGRAGRGRASAAVSRMDAHGQRRMGGRRGEGGRKGDYGWMEQGEEYEQTDLELSVLVRRLLELEGR